MTSGQGRYTMALSHYEAVPPTVQQTLIGQYRVREED
jgi:elongation factor G